ncbi:VanZ family protein [Anaerotignum lactatifermentans]|uniref:VanZ family protein n=2 Tax=Anaerotignum lactatifermentans TaxID=160404 RepID=A0ABS2G8U6_9FIRM|nr:VanZ family protein [Anaerotignum lactatifermentans]MBM6877292.1 VanZ family protein [Anaerotignum lactatifermentans]MBM6950664.1 VanZ family protein [Anaerotignum lactatifermentans]
MLSSVILFLAAVPWLWLWQCRGDHQFSPLLYRVGVWVFCFYLIGLAAATGVAALLFQAPVFAPYWNGILLADLFLCPEQYVLNIILFLPLGFLAPLLWASWRQERKVMLLGFGVSALIEILQMFCGRTTDVDDLLMNTMGAVLGYLFFCWVQRETFSYYVKKDGSQGLAMTALRQLRAGEQILL